MNNDFSGGSFQGAIAFYLPQFHPIPENDRWWGKGFTEWTNVSRARPLFDGHYQPRLPADLGFYDLRLPEILEAQADLARASGLRGFCYHYYWFKGGRRLLERPLERMLASGRPDFPFCLCWANENWTRRWDGLEREVLMPQAHDAESDIGFLHSVLPYFDDPRYLRIGDRPLLVVYRATLFPDLGATVQRWRSECAKLARPTPYLIAAESFDVTPELAARAGFDATCEFPPHAATHAIVPRSQWPGVADTFVGSITDYERMVEQFLGREDTALRRFKSVTLNWDNTARKRHAANVTVGFSIERYHRWLTAAIAHSRRTAPPGEQFVFINAWNEWGEGTYLEPDQLFGHAYLDATHAALQGRPFRYQYISESSSASPAESMPARPAGTSGSATMGAVCMVADDADIIEACIREALRFVDFIVVACRDSVDGTRQILEALVAEGLPVYLRPADKLDVSIAALTRVAIEQHGADWVLPLEPDEFLHVADRASLDRQLEVHPGQHLRIARITHVPTVFDDGREPNPAARLQYRFAFPQPPSGDSQHQTRIIANAALLGPFPGRYELGAANQNIVFRDTKQPSRQPAAAVEGVHLRHFPIRSLDQLALKFGRARDNVGPRAPWHDLPGLDNQTLWDELSVMGSDASSLQRFARHYLDPDLHAPDRTGDVPLVLDALPITAELRYLGLRRSPVVALLSRPS